MKRLIHIVLLLFYFVANSHAVVNMHFCRGNLIELEIWTDVEGCGGKKSPSRKCCEDVSVSIEAPGDQVKPASIEIPETVQFHSAEFPIPVCQISFSPAAVAIKPSHYPPPDDIPERIFLQTRSLRL